MVKLDTPKTMLTNKQPDTLNNGDEETKKKAQIIKTKVNHYIKFVACIF